MFRNASVSIYVPTSSVNDEGATVRTWPTTPAVTFQADVQPKALNQAEIELYGLSNLKGNTMKMFCTYAQVGYCLSTNRAKVTGRATGGVEQTFTMQPVNSWPNHCEVLLVPVIG